MLGLRRAQPLYNIQQKVPQTPQVSVSRPSTGVVAVGLVAALIVGVGGLIVYRSVKKRSW